MLLNQRGCIAAQRSHIRKVLQHEANAARAPLPHFGTGAPLDRQWNLKKTQDKNIVADLKNIGKLDLLKASKIVFSRLMDTFWRVTDFRIFEINGLVPK